MTDEFGKALAGHNLAVDVASIEKTLAELWRAEGEGNDDAVTRAALWNVVAHTASDADRTFASEILGRASASVPQRTMIIRASRNDEEQINSWISANCHLLGHGKQVCSEEIVITAGGARVDYVPPLVQALLLPELPVAAWWIGDLPSEEEQYLASLLGPVDHLIVDSSRFDDIDDLRFLRKCGVATNTSPSDLNWTRLEGWRIAVASMFDAPDVLSRGRRIRRIGVGYDSARRDYFGAKTEPILLVAWMLCRLGYEVRSDGRVEGAAGNVTIELQGEEPPRAGGVRRFEIEFDDALRIALHCDSDAAAIRGEVRGLSFELASVTSVAAPTIESLVVRQLARSGSDRLYAEVLPAAIRISQELAS